MTDKLKPCPFCGSKADFEPKEITFYGVWIKCPQCGIELHNIYETREDAANAWNRRAEA